jgi:hypothetical protein
MPGAPFFLLVLATATLSAPTTDAAGNRLENMRLVKPSDGAPSTQGCTADGSLCAEILADDGELVLHVHAPKGGMDLRYDLSESGKEGGDGDFALWPRIIRLAGKGNGALVGVTWNIRTMYSGGGGSASELRLVHVRPGTADPKTVLSIPVDGSIMIRACFSEEDMRQRAEACHDEYDFRGALALDRAVAAGPPRLIYTARATSFPGHVSRSEDSLSAPPLHKKDLIWVTDSRCTYRRMFRWHPSSRSYQPDSPLPDCSDYTTP